MMVVVVEVVMQEVEKEMDLHSASMNQFFLDEGSWQRCQRIVKVFPLHLSFIVQSNKSKQHKHSLRTGVLYQMPGYVSHPTLQTFRAIKALKVLSKLRIHFENQNFPTIIHIKPSQQALSQCSQHKYIYKSCKFAWHVISFLIILFSFLGPRGLLRTLLVPFVRCPVVRKLFSFPFLSDSKLTQPLPQYTVHRTLNRINSRTFLAQFGLFGDGEQERRNQVFQEQDIMQYHAI